MNNNIKQKNYSIFQELYHSGPNRVKKKYLGRLRRYISEKAESKARNISARHAKLDKEFNNDLIEDIENRDLARKLIREGRKRSNTRVFDNNKLGKILYRDTKGNSSFVIKTDKKLKDTIGSKLDRNYYSPETKKVYKSILDRDNIINLSKEYDKSVLTLAHELGHTYNRNYKNSSKFKNIVSRLNTHNKTSESVEKLQNTERGKERLKANLKKDLIQYLEEKNAWNNAKKMLKRNGATKEELSIMKNHRNKALKSYELEMKRNVSEGIRDMYMPKGLRRDLPIYNLSNGVKDSDNEILRKKFMNRYGGSVSIDEIDDMISKLKGRKDLSRELRNRKNKRNKNKNQSTLNQIFGNW